MKLRFHYEFSPELIITVILGAILSVSPFFYGGEHYTGKLILYAGVGLAGFFWLFTVPRIIRSAWWRNPDVLLALLLCIAAISVALSPSLITSLEAYVGLIAMVAIMLFARSIVSEAHQRLLVRMLVNGGAAMAAFSIGTLIYFANAIRIYAPFKNADGVGTALVVPLILNIGLLANEKGWAKRWYIGTFCILMLAFVMASTVSAIIGLCVAAIVWWLALKPQRIEKPVIIGAVIIIAGALIATYGLRQYRIQLSPTWQQNPVALLTGFGEFDASNSFYERMSYLATSLHMANNQKLSGVGYGMWSDTFPQYGDPAFNRSALAHSTLFQTIGELGWPGGIAFAALMLAIAVSAIQNTRNLRQPVFAGIAFAAMAGSVAAMMDIAWFYPSTALTAWALIGVALSPAATPVEQKHSRMAVAIGGCILAVGLLAWGILRSTTAYLVAEAERAGNKRQWVDAFATGNLAMRLLPNSPEELRIGLLQDFGANYTHDKATAREYAERIVRHNPVQPAGYLLLGQILAGAGEQGRAEEVLRKGLDQGTHWVPDLAVELSRLLILEERYTEGREVALAMMKNIGRGVPNAEVSQSNLATSAAVAELKLGMRDEARAHLNEALLLNPGNTQASNVLRESFEDGIE